MSCSRARGTGQPAVHTRQPPPRRPAKNPLDGTGATKGTRGGGTAAVVPLRLVAWFVTSPALGDELVTTLTLALAEYAPTSLGLKIAERDRRAKGPRGGLLALVFVAGGLEDLAAALG